MFRPSFVSSRASACSSAAGASSWTRPLLGAALALLLLQPAACGGGGEDQGRGGGSPRAGASEGAGGGEGARSRRGGGPGAFGRASGGPPGGTAQRGVPVEVVAAQRQPIALYFETQGVLEAEQEVDLVARTGGPITELRTEQGRRVSQGQLLARIDDREIQAQLTVTQVRLAETRQAYERSKALLEAGLTSQETVDVALANYESAQGENERLKVLLQYTEVRAPYGGLIVERYVKLAQNVAAGEPLFRISDFEPLLCPIPVPEKELPRLTPGQPAHLTVEAWPGQRFEAKILRVSPVVDAETGTVEVTLEVAGEGKLRPGMFASVFLEMESKPEALVVPKRALALDSLEDTVFVAEAGIARRRVLEVGFKSADSLEVLSGVEEGEKVVVVGQDGLSEGTPVEVLKDGDGNGVASRAQAGAPGSGGSEASAGGPPGRGGRGAGGGPGAFDPANLTPEQIDRIKERMRSRGLSEDQIEERLQRMKEGEFPVRGGPGGRRGGAPGGTPNGTEG